MAEMPTPDSPDRTSFLWLTLSWGGGDLKTPRSVACTHPEFALVGRKTYAVTPRTSAPRKAGTPAASRSRLRRRKSLFFPSLVVDQRNLSSAGIIMGGGEKPSREFLSLKQGNSTGNSAQRGGAGLLRLGTSAGGPRERDERGARERDKRGAREWDESGARNVQ